MDQLERVIGPVSVEHLPGHPGQDVRPEDDIASGVGGAEREAVVVLCSPVEPGVPCHGRRGAGQLRHDAVQAVRDGGGLVVVQRAGDLRELTEDCLPSQAAAVLVVPLTEGARGRFQFLHLAYAETPRPAPPGDGGRRDEPPLEAVEEGGAGDGGTGEGVGEGTSVHHEITPGEVGGQVHGGVRPPRDLVCVRPDTWSLWRVRCGGRALPGARCEPEQAARNAEAVSDPAHHVEGRHALGSTDDRGHLAGGEPAGGGDAVLGEAAPLLEQGEGGGEVVLRECCPYVCSVEHVGGEQAGGVGIHGL
ncbi:hypothetical protein GTY69_27515 [Streptomyces sp. SID8364]|nr:hypothetical protein [Streptomyces sp. MnatMP-M77]MYT81380.1 hypothetical protein [Streptomyces sp. SID8364]